jgi:hypothetical protein
MDNWAGAFIWIIYHSGYAVGRSPLFKPLAPAATLFNGDFATNVTTASSIHPRKRVLLSVNHAFRLTLPGAQAVFFSTNS